jgi:hypothetical protein
MALMSFTCNISAVNTAADFLTSARTPGISIRLSMTLPKPMEAAGFHGGGIATVNGAYCRTLATFFISRFRVLSFARFGLYFWFQFIHLAMNLVEIHIIGIVADAFTKMRKPLIEIPHVLASP